MIGQSPKAFAKYTRTPRGTLVFSKGLVKNAEDSGAFPPGDATLAALKAEVVGLDEAMIDAKDKSALAMEARNSAAIKVQQQLGHFVDRVQALADLIALPADARTFIVSMGLSVRKTSRSKKAELAARYTGVPREVQLDARRIKGAAAYYWEYSLDQQSWTALPETPNGRTLVDGLTPGQVVYFRFRTLSLKGKSEYCAAVSIMVH